QDVRAMFVPLVERPELVHNIKLTHTINKMAGLRKARQRAGLAGASKRYETKPLFSAARILPSRAALAENKLRYEDDKNQRFTARSSENLLADTYSPPGP